MHCQMKLTNVTCPDCEEDLRYCDTAETEDCGGHGVGADELSGICIEFRADCPDVLMMVQAVKQHCKETSIQMVCAECTEDMPFDPDFNECSTCRD